jgi:hypothetical protein
VTPVTPVTPGTPRERAPSPGSLLKKTTRSGRSAGINRQSVAKEELAH